MLHVNFRCEPYSANIVFYTDATSKQVNNHMKKKYHVVMDCEPEDAGAQCKVKPDTEGSSLMYFLWIRHCEDIAILVHECIHLAFDILSDRDIPITPEDNEALAYYHNYLFKTLWNEMVVYTEKKNNKKRAKEDA